MRYLLLFFGMLAIAGALVASSTNIGRPMNVLHWFGFGLWLIGAHCIASLWLALENGPYAFIAYTVAFFYFLVLWLIDMSLEAFALRVSRAIHRQP